MWVTVERKASPTSNCTLRKLVGHCSDQNSYLAHNADIQVNGSCPFIAHPEDCEYRRSVARLHGYISVLFAHRCDLAVPVQS